MQFYGSSCFSTGLEVLGNWKMKSHYETDFGFFVPQRVVGEVKTAVSVLSTAPIVFAVSQRGPQQGRFIYSDSASCA